MESLFQYAASLPKLNCTGLASGVYIVMVNTPFLLDTFLASARSVKQVVVVMSAIVA